MHCAHLMRRLVRCMSLKVIAACTLDAVPHSFLSYPHAANGLAGLSVILSVCLMGFLVSSSVMPEGWLWAYNANLFRYILQGLVTNEISGQAYKIDVGALIPEINKTSDDTGRRQNSLDNVFGTSTNSGNTKAITFMPGTIPEGDNAAAQAARLVGLILNAGDGENANTPQSHDDFNNLVRCLMDNECMIEPVSTNFIQCTATPVSVCAHEFDATINHRENGGKEVAGCFYGHHQFDGVASNLSFTDETDREIASCMTRKLLPVDSGIHRIIQGFKDLYNIVMWIQDIVENGLDIPGDAILFYFGWSEFDVDGFEFRAPWKWHYCVTAVAIFLSAMEAIKLLAVQFIVWTKR
jgi:hypothetical protein